MRFLAPLACLLIAGCLSATPPAARNDDPLKPTGTVSVAQFGEALARYVSGENCKTTDEFFKVAAQAATDCGVPPTALDQLGEVGDSQEFDDKLRADFAARCRKLK